ncbi:MAG: efflux RND transporter permease subunit, partial [Elusimicrobia bacterium]|nr:efflux RND transporter permease subunit [Elusimicrobiota bacterium]
MPEKSLFPIILFSAFILLTARWMPRRALRRPALIGVLTVGLIVWGLLSLKSLPVELMPNIASETVAVTVNVRGGMPPHDVETLIIRPMEEALGDIGSLNNLFSSAKKDRGVVTLFFKPGVDMKVITSEVHERMERAIPKLPPEIEKPVIAHFEESDSPVYIGAITSPRFSPEEIRKIVDERIKDKLLRVPGVANVEVGGGRERKILIEVDRDRLRAYGLSIQRVVSLLGRRNVAVQVGSVEGSQRVSPIQLVGSFKNVSDMKKVMVSRDSSGGMILLENIAAVKDSYMESESLSRLNSQSAVSFYVQKETTGNTLQVVRGLEQALDESWRDLPASIRKSLERVTVSDQAVSIRSAIASVRMSLVTGVLLIVLVLCLFQSALPRTRRLAGATLGVLLFFLSVSAMFQISQASVEIPLILVLGAFVFLAVFNPDLRPSFIVGGSIPLSALFCFLLFQASGITLNVMSLFGLALGIGMLVDNATVVYENIMSRFKEHPELPRMETALKATEEMVIPLIGATVTNAVVFVPFMFLSKDIQRLYMDVAAAVGASLFASMGVSLTVVPLLTAFVALGNPSSSFGFSIKLNGKWSRAAAALQSGQRLSNTIWDFLTRLLNSFYRRIPSMMSSAQSKPFFQKSCAFVCNKHFAREAAWIVAVLFAGLWLTGFKGSSKSIFIGITSATIFAGFLRFRGYAGVWETLLRKRFTILAAAGALTLASLIILAWGMERDFQTSGELDEFVIFVELSSGAKLSVSDDVVKEIEKAIGRIPEAASSIKTLVSRVEGWSSKLYVTLKPRAERKLSTQEVVNLLRQKLENVGRDKDENAFIHFSSPQSGQEVTVQITGPDYSVLERLAQQVTAGLEKVKGLEDVKMRYRPGRPEVQVVVDPDKVSRYDLSVEDVAETAHALMRGLRATTFRTQGNQVETIVRLRLEDRETLASLVDLPIFVQGQQLRLGNVARIEMGKMPNEIYRENKQRLIQITANRAKISLGRAAEEIQKSLQQIRLPLEYVASIEGDFEEMSRSLRQMLWGVLVMVLIVYLVLVLLFESLLQPFIIMATVPLCLIGAVWGLVLLKIPVTTGVMVGLMMLGGIVVNNA